MIPVTSPTKTSPPAWNSPMNQSAASGEGAEDPGRLLDLWLFGGEGDACAAAWAKVA